MPSTDLIRADWYTRTVSIMTGDTIAANRRHLVEQLAPGFTWNTGRPLSEAERVDTQRCLEILDTETERRAVLAAQSVGIARKGA